MTFKYLNVQSYYLKHGLGDSALKVSLAQMAHLGGKKLVASKGADDDVETGHDGEGLGQEVAVLAKLVNGNISEGGEFLLVFRVVLNQPLIKLQMNMKTTVPYS